MIKLIITDMDGTFLNSQGDYNREMFKEIKQLMADKNVHFAICTGKQCERVEQLLGEDSENFWIMGDSASRIKYQGEYAYQQLIDNKLGLDMIATIERANIDSNPIIIACTTDSAFLRDDVHLDMIKRMKKSYANVRLVSEYDHIQNDFIKITVYDQELRCADLKPYLTAYENKAYIVVSEPAWMDIADYGVNKGNTAERLQKMLNISPEETMVFGDGKNDAELMPIGKYSYAVSNAIDEIKALANYQTHSNDEDGVLRAIKDMLVLQ